MLRPLPWNFFESRFFQRESSAEQPLSLGGLEDEAEKSRCRQWRRAVYPTGLREETPALATVCYWLLSSSLKYIQMSNKPSIHINTVYYTSMYCMCVLLYWDLSATYTFCSWSLNLDIEDHILWFAGAWPWGIDTRCGGQGWVLLEEVIAYHAQLTSGNPLQSMIPAVLFW